MKLAFLAPAFAALFLAASLTSPVASAQEDADLAEARGIVKSFSERLKGELVAAMKAGGPANGIAVCQQVAPAIAAEAAETSGWKVGRTALRVRNPANRPNDVEALVLEAFASRHEAGESFAKMEHVGTVDGAEGSFLHYMKAIPLGEVCATCHGTEVAPDLTKVIREYYPEDQATGFEVGALRGAFTLYKPLD